MELLGGIFVSLYSLKKAALHRKALCLDRSCCEKHNHKISSETNDVGRAMFTDEASMERTTMCK